MSEASAGGEPLRPVFSPRSGGRAAPLPDFHPREFARHGTRKPHDGAADSLAKAGTRASGLSRDGSRACGMRRMNGSWCKTKLEQHACAMVRWLTSISFIFLNFPLWVVKGLYHYWTYYFFFPRGLSKWKLRSPYPAESFAPDNQPAISSATSKAETHAKGRGGSGSLAEINRCWCSRLIHFGDQSRISAELWPCVYLC